MLSDARLAVRVFSLITLLAPFSAAGSELNPNLWQTVVNKEFGFRISYPNDWIQVPTKGPNVRVSVSPSQGPGNCNVVARLFPDLASLSQTQLNAEVEAMAIDNAGWSYYTDIPSDQISVLESYRAKIVNVSAILGVLEVFVDTLEGRFFGKKSIAMAFTPGTMWTITCGVSTYETEAGRSRYRDLEPYLSKVMGSFVFLNSN